MTKKRKPSQFELAVKDIELGLFCTKCNRRTKYKDKLNLGMWTHLSTRCTTCGISITKMYKSEIVRRAINHATY